MKQKINIILILIALFTGVLSCTIALKAIEKKEKKDVQNSFVQPECKHDDTTFCSDLPVIMIDTKGQRIFKEEEIFTTISVIDNLNGNNHIDGKPQINSAATVKYRGNSSYYVFDKKQYKISFYENDKKDKEKYTLCGMAAESDWVLYGPFLDRSLMRNEILYGISREIFDWAPDTRYCEVFVNGEYKGVYLAVESIEKGDTRLNLSDFGLLSGQTPYIIKRDRIGTEDIILHSYGEKQHITTHELSLVYPSVGNVTNKQIEWIEKDISVFEEVLYGDNFDNSEIGYTKYIDIDSFLDYYIINEFAMNVDASGLSTYLYKDLIGKLHITVWDFNNAFDNYPWSEKQYDKFYLADVNWYDRLLEDRSFVTALISRYDELRKTVLSEEYIFGRINNNIEYLGDAVERNFEVWGYTFVQELLAKGVEGNVRDPKSFQEAIELLKNTISNRLLFLDENMELLYDNCIN